MPGVVYYCAASLDGYIADASDGVGWLTGYQGSYAGAGAEPIEGSYARFYEGIGALVSGSVSYEFVLGETARGAAWPYTGKPCWVLSSRDLPLPEGEDVRIVNGPVSELHDEMIASAGERDLWLVGGGNVASQLSEAGLLDELRVHVVPVVLGSGKPLFERPLRPGSLSLAGVTPRDNGMVELRYAVRR